MFFGTFGSMKHRHVRCSPMFSHVLPVRPSFVVFCINKKKNCHSSAVHLRNLPSNQRQGSLRPHPLGAETYNTHESRDVPWDVLVDFLWFQWISWSTSGVGEGDKKTLRLAAQMEQPSFENLPYLAISCHVLKSCLKNAKAATAAMATRRRWFPMITFTQPTCCLQYLVFSTRLRSASRTHSAHIGHLRNLSNILSSNLEFCAIWIDEAWCSRAFKIYENLDPKWQ